MARCTHHGVDVRWLGSMCRRLTFLPLMSAELDRVVELELRLLRPDVRRDRAAVSALLHRDFVEVGASGRRWHRDEVIDHLVESPGTAVGVRDINAQVIAKGVVLLTYTATTDGRTTHRSSLWVSAGPQWSVIYHQGTPSG